MRLSSLLMTSAALMAIGVGCNSSRDRMSDRAQSASGRMTWESELDKPMKAVLDQHAELGPKPIETLTPQQARTQPSPADAVAALLRRQGKDPKPEQVGMVDNRMIPGAAGEIAARIYTPAGNGPFPIVLYIHGGGWVIATIDTYDASARALCNAANAIVVSVEYRKGPEAKFPAAHEDCFAAWRWVVQNTAALNGDANHIDVAGESAGGNMALAVSMMARDRGMRLPNHQVLVYPVSQLGDTTPSISKYANAKPLNAAMLTWFGQHYTSTPADMSNPLLNPLKSANLGNLPPTTVITAQIDPLMSEGKMLADKLEAAGNTVRYRNYEGVTHEFFGMTAVLPEARDAVKFAAGGLK